MNIMTIVQEGVYQKLKQFDEHVKNSVTEPYGQRKSTLKEQKEMYQNLTPEKFLELERTEGLVPLNKWLSRMEKRS